MKHKLKLLKHENYKYSQNLLEEDEAVIKRILNYLRTARLCSYQTEIVRKDLIGILMLLFLACTLANQFILPRFSLERGVRRFLLNTGVLIVTYAPAFIFALYGRTNHSGILLTIPILPFSFCLLLLWGISEFFYRREIEKTAALLS